MSTAHRHTERHRSQRGGWLRAAVLGADDGIVSTASLMIGVAASNAERGAILLAGVAGIIAGAMSMAAGEYVSVSSQRDAEQADIEREKRELSTSHAAELDELTHIYVERGLEPALARTVAEQLSAHDSLGTHLRDELGLSEDELARPMQAAVVSAVSFASLAVVPVLALLAAPQRLWIASIAGAAVLSLAILGGVGGRLGGASPFRAATRVVAGGTFAMGLSAVVGRLLGVAGL
jgi:VIT1/CCC1 family predicted Fe2+/Mn2+ transporter